MISRHVLPQFYSPRLWILTPDITSWTRCLRFSIGAPRYLEKMDIPRINALMASSAFEDRNIWPLFDSIHWLTPSSWRYAPVLLYIYMLPPWMVDCNLETAGLLPRISKMEVSPHAPPLLGMPLSTYLRDYKYVGPFGKKTAKISVPISIVS